MALQFTSARACLVAPVALFLPTLAAAQAAVPGQDIGGGVLHLIAALAVVLVLLFASLWLLKRLSAPRGAAAGFLRVIAGTAVGARERVVVVEVGTTWLVLGVAPGRVSALAEMPRAPLPAEDATSPTKDFAGRLKSLLDRHNAR